MKFCIERVEWKEQREVVLDVLGRAFTTPDARYRHIHEGNPAGPGAVWLARAADGTAVGTVAVHRRRLLLAGRPYGVGQTADFAVDRAARGFGPALALQRSAVDACERGEFAFLFGFPNQAARPVLERIGYRAISTLRLARPLSSRTYLERWAPPLARPMAVPVDFALGLLTRGVRRGGRHRVLERLAAFDESFDRFWRRARARYPVVGDRDHQGMNWRYVEWPTRRYDAYALREGGELAAALVCYRLDGIACIAEMLAVDASTADEILLAFVRNERRAGARAVSLIVLGDGHLASPLARRRFFRRDVPRTMMVYLPASSPRLEVEDPGRWCLFEGDIL